MLRRAVMQLRLVSKGTYHPEFQQKEHGKSMLQQISQLAEQGPDSSLALRAHMSIQHLFNGFRIQRKIKRSATRTENNAPPLGKKTVKCDRQNRQKKEGKKVHERIGSENKSMSFKKQYVTELPKAKRGRPRKIFKELKYGQPSRNSETPSIVPTSPKKSGRPRKIVRKPKCIRLCQNSKIPNIVSKSRKKFLLRKKNTRFRRNLRSVKSDLRAGATEKVIKKRVSKRKVYKKIFGKKTSFELDWKSIGGRMM